MIRRSERKCAPAIVAVAAAAVLVSSQSAIAQNKGPSTGSTPYVLPTNSFISTYSILTVDNTGSLSDDSVGGYSMVGIPDGLGAFDNGNNTFFASLQRSGALHDRDHSRASGRGTTLRHSSCA